MRFRQKTNFKINIYVLLIFVLNFYLLRNGILFGKFHPVDDHHILYFINENINLRQYFHILFNETEVGNFGTAGQYRPSYWAILLFETIIFGKNTALYYLARAIFLSIFSISLFKIFTLYFHRLTSFMLIVFYLKMPFLGGIFNRLGPGENYSTFGMSLIFLGVFKLLLLKKQDGDFEISDFNKGYQLLLLGSLINLGIKQNWIANSLGIIILLFVYKGKLNKASKIFSSIYLVYFVLIMTSTIIFLRSSNVDFYGTEINLLNRIIYSFEFLYKGNIEISLSIIVLFILTVLNSVKDYSQKKISARSIVYFYIFIRFSWEVFFYSGVLVTFFDYKFPWWSNYNFPIYLSLPVAGILLIDFINENKYLKSRGLVNLNIAIISACLLVILFQHPTYKYGFFIENRNFSTSSYTSQYNVNLKQLSKKVTENNVNQIIVYTNNLEDDEKFLNLDDWFYYYSIDSKIMIDFTEKGLPKNTLENLRVENIIKYENYSSGLFRPISEFDKNSSCIILPNNAEPIELEIYNNCIKFYLWPNYEY
jgi:hypothetical protein